MPGDAATSIAEPTAPIRDARVEQEEFRTHEHFYENVVRAVWIFIAHVAVILALMAYFLT